jgi:hypothetical protein
MCTTSAVSDDWLNRNPQWPPIVYQPPQITIPLGPTREEFDALKKEMQELKELLKAAKKYDEATGQPDCEMEDKVKILTDLAKMVGIDLTEVFNNHK